MKLNKSVFYGSALILVLLANIAGSLHSRAQPLMPAHTFYEKHQSLEQNQKTASIMTKSDAFF